MKSNFDLISEDILLILENTRNYVERNYAPPYHGKCIEASKMIFSQLKKAGVNVCIVEGWCLYDDENYGSDRSYDEHTWVEVNLDGKKVILDVTLDQFSHPIFEEIPRIYVGSLPRFLSYNEP